MVLANIGVTKDMGSIVKDIKKVKIDLWSMETRGIKDE